ncbi:helix-turn-helix domain-containing protein [Streptomyces sp. WMMC897]|uniref:helix-turn-helix domain-containing protein n=1 Tax=Streptomyces sp. WMMC897 TaxID=3014782 RepID=UPI0022B6C265|nr:helix-turn-helix transcriptional regulator [Streptomyces sp. WMMC897]MCZ7414326.1 helix-turn-helix transcriptional regulator [Streptomyces sp. WMMC897]
MPETPDIGSRLRSIRKRRGLTQRELAQAADVSISLVSKLEQGVIEDVRLETAHRLARALRVRTTSLIQRDEEEGTPRPGDTWAPVRAALLAPPADRIEEAPSVAGLRRTLADAEPLFAAVDLHGLAVVLPPLLRDADALDSEEAGARAVQAQLLQLSGWLMVQTRQYEAAAVALDRALDTAPDALDGAATVNSRAWLHLRRGELAAARELATRWADDVEPRLSRASHAELAAWGWMLLRVAGAAVRDNRRGEAADALRLAQVAATAIGREEIAGRDTLRTFGPVTVTQHRAEHAAVTDRPDLVLSLAERMPPGETTGSNRARHLVQVADAHTRLRQYPEAVQVLQQVQRTAPEWLPQQRFARDVVGRIVGRRRTLTKEMRALATAVALPL